MGGNRGMNTVNARVLSSIAMCLFTVVCAGFLHAQSKETSDWEKAAGGKMSFEIASVKPHASGSHGANNVSLDSGNGFTPTGGLFRTVSSVQGYIGFAYKLNQAQRSILASELPKWAHDDQFEIEARASADATKDQMRLMMQSLLADRFKFAGHTEMRQLPVFALLLVKSGKMGPQLRHYEDDPPCSMSADVDTAAAAPTKSFVGGIPPMCDAFVGFMSPDGHASFGARNVSMEEIADSLPGFPDAGLDRPVVDRTGLSGKFDFSLEMNPDVFRQRTGQPPSDAQSDNTPPTFLETLRDNLGLKLEPTTGSVDVLVVDHVEEPVSN
jgi:bla regulator protein BlaR1